MQHLRFSLLILIISVTTVTSWSQRSIVYYELILGDSVALYFNKEFLFTEKDCYDYVRHIRVTENGDFNGYFEDKSVDGRLLAKGAYRDGFKHGYFELFYPHGSIYARGYYENNKPVGNWEFYYPNRLLERVLTVTDSTVLLMRHIDETGTVRIENGEGTFNGAVKLSREFRDLPEFAQVYNGMLAAGKVIAGKPHGRWFIPEKTGQAYYTEKYDNGKLIRSSRVPKRKLKISRQTPKLNAFFLDNHLTMLEIFERESCSESQQFFFNRYPNDLRAFSYDLRQKMDYIIYTDLRSDRKEYYERGDNVMVLQFSVNEKGKPYNIKLLSEWGESFRKVAENSLNKTVFSTNSKTMYFHLKVSYAGGYMYKYNFRFSKRDRIR